MTTLKERKSNSGQRDSKVQRRDEVLPVLPIFKGDVQRQNDLKDDVTYSQTYTHKQDVLKDDVTFKQTNRENTNLIHTDRHDHGQLADNMFQSDKSSHQVSKAKPNLSAGHKSITEFLIPAKLKNEIGTMRSFSNFSEGKSSISICKSEVNTTGSTLRLHEQEQKNRACDSVPTVSKQVPNCSQSTSSGGLYA